MCHLLIDGLVPLLLDGDVGRHPRLANLALLLLYQSSERRKFNAYLPTVHQTHICAQTNFHANLAQSCLPITGRLSSTVIPKVIDATSAARHSGRYDFLISKSGNDSFERQRSFAASLPSFDHRAEGNVLFTAQPPNATHGIGALVMNATRYRCRVRSLIPWFAA